MTMLFNKLHSISEINSGKILTVPFTQSKCGIEYSLKLIIRWSFSNEKNLVQL